MYDLLKLFQVGRSHMVALVQPDEEDIQDVLDELAPERSASSSSSSSSAPSRAGSIDLERQRLVAVENVNARASRTASIAGGSDVAPGAPFNERSDAAQVRHSDLTYTLPGFHYLHFQWKGLAGHATCLHGAMRLLAIQARLLAS